MRAAQRAFPLFLVLLAACGPSPAPEDAPAASARRPRAEVVEALEADLRAVRHPSDGGGEAAVEPAAGTPPAIPAGSAGRWRIRYRAGPLGVAEGGMIFFQASPFWGWSTPQVEDPAAPGYTVVTSGAPGVVLSPRTLDRQLLGIAVGGRALAPGEEVVIDYGAGPAGAYTDRFAERRSRLWIAVDGDGDGVRRLIAESPAVDVVAGEAAQLSVLLPSTARPGEGVDLVLAVLDRLGNAGVRFAGDVALSAEPALPGLPPAVRFEPADGGLKRIAVSAGEPGVVRVVARALGGDWRSNPLQVTAGGARVLWGDLQVHSGLSDGTGLPADLLHYAREVAALDVVALTDHDHWGMRFLDQTPSAWREIGEAVRRRHQPGRFVALLGFEWTSWIHGHRHVLYFDDRGEVLSSLDPRWDEPRELWAALRGRRALTLAHHSAGGPIATDWSIPPDPALEPLTEIVSVHGSSEAADAPLPIHRPVPGNFVRDALGRGYRLGFVGSSDGHDGHPGLAHLASPSGGLAAILAEEATREAVYEALKARRTYATNGPRILLRASFGGWPMGSDVPLGGGRPPLDGLPPDLLLAQVIAPRPLARIDVVRSGRVVAAVPCGGELDCRLSQTAGDLRAGEYLYLRAVQEDGGAAWSSPFFFVD